MDVNLSPIEKTSIGPREFLLEVFQSATRPSLGALLVTFAVTLTCFGSATLVFTPDLLSSEHHRYLSSEKRDTWLNVTHRAHVLRRATPHDLQVVIFGASLTQWCISTDDDVVIDLIERSSGIRPELQNLCSDDQTVWEVAALAEYLPARFDGVVVFGLTAPVLLRSPDDKSWETRALAGLVVDPRLGFVSEAFDEEARLAGMSTPFRTGFFAIDNGKFLLARRSDVIKNLIQGPPTYDPSLEDLWSHFRSRDQYDDENWPAQINDSLSRQYQANVDRNLAVIARSMDRLKKRGRHSFVVLAPPENPRCRDEPIGEQFFRRHEEHMKRFAAEHQMSYLSAGAQLNLTESDFVDYWGHVSNRAVQLRCTEVCSSHVASLLLKVQQ